MRSSRKKREEQNGRIVTLPKTGWNSKKDHLGVSKNRDTPKWMVKIMENPIKMDDLGGFPLFFETPIWVQLVFLHCNFLGVITTPKFNEFAHEKLPSQ